MSTPSSQPGPARRTLRILRPHVRGHRLLLAGGGGALLLEVVFRVLEPWPVKFVVDAVTRSLGADIGEPGPAATTQLLLACALMTVAIVGLRALTNYLSTVAFALGGSRIATALRQRVFDHLASLSARYHSTARTGDLVQRLVGDVGRLQEVAVTAGLPLLANVVTLFAMTGVMLWLDPVLALVVVVAAALFVVLSRFTTGTITSAARATRSQEGELANLASETLGAMPLVQAYGLEKSLSRRFSGSNTRSLRDGVKARRLSAALERRTDVIVGAATAVVLFVGGLRVTQSAMTPGDLVIFLTYLKTAMKPLRDMAKYTGRIARAAASGERVADVLDVRPDIVGPDRPVPSTRIRGHLELIGVHADYGDGVPVLRGIDLQVPPGQRVALVGSSGSGKSTLGSLLVRLMDPTHGSVRFDGTDLRAMDLEHLRSQVAVVLQDSVLFTGTIAENIRQGRPDATPEQGLRAASAARADEFIQALPDGYSTTVGERGSTLSGGQRQRIAIARALLRDAPVVLLDEATSGLDPDNATAVREAMSALTRGRTTVVVTHDESTARGCDRIVWLDRGAVVWDGPADSDISLGAAFLEPSDGPPPEDRQPARVDPRTAPLPIGVR